MNSQFQNSFGILIAYVLPGSIVVAGLSWHWPLLATWLHAEPSSEPSLGGFLYAGMAALTAGLITSAIRWAVIDSLHHYTGLSAPNFDFTRLPDRLESFSLAVEHYYRYYQFYANTLIAQAIFTVCYLSAGGSISFRLAAVGLSVGAVLFVASRDSLRRYYTRVSLLLGTFRPLPSSILGFVLSESPFEFSNQVQD